MKRSQSALSGTDTHNTDTATHGARAEKRVQTDTGSNELQRQNRARIFLTSGFMVVFSLGVIAGFQIHRWQHIEDNLIKYPDESRSVSRSSDSTDDAMVPADLSGNSGGNHTATGEQSFANVGGSRSSTEREEDRDGIFMIQMVNLPPSSAEKLTSGLNNLDGLAQVHPRKCPHFEESVPDRYLSFRTPSDSNSRKQNVVVGCFAEEETARSVLKIIKSSGIPGSASARIFQSE